jgi:hypothetical protein
VNYVVMWSRIWRLYYIYIVTYRPVAEQ